MGKLDALWQYQQAELDKERVETEILNTPARVKLNKLHGFLSEQQAAINTMQKDMEQRSGQLTKLMDQFQKLQARRELEMSELSELEKDEQVTSEEAAELKRDLQTLLDEIGNMRKELQEMIQFLEKAGERYKDTRNKAGKAKKEYDALRIVCEEEVAQRKGVLAEKNAALENYAKNVEPALMEKYRRIKRNYPAPMAELIGQKCGGCNMSLATAVAKRVVGNDTLVECENCGRILYISE